MISVLIFTISGLAISILIVAKKFEQKRRKTFLIFKLISKSNIRLRRLYHTLVHLYSEGKEKVSFFLKRQIPLHSKNSSNKLFSYLVAKKEKYINNMRDSRLLKKSDGISEFFKNMSSVEKGNGEIHDIYEDTSPNDRSVGRGSQDEEKKVR